MSHPSDVHRLKRLNREYVAAWLAGDLRWYRDHLAEDFECIESDGSVLDKAAFLRRTAGGPDVASYRLERVTVRILGDVGLVRGCGRWTDRHGTLGTSRYTDVYVRDDGAWRVAAAQVTRAAAEG